jgi:hypothetical protein
MIARNVSASDGHEAGSFRHEHRCHFPDALIADLASRPLQPNRLYRVDRHDVDPAVPVGAPLATILNHCATHQHRVHTRSGSYVSNSDGSIARLDDDIVDGREARLGDGWHVREADGRSGFLRWAGSRAALIVQPEAARTGSLALEMDIEANPRDRRHGSGSKPSTAIVCCRARWCPPGRACTVA